MNEIGLETELPIGSNLYRVGRMSVFDQMNVAADFRSILIGLALMKRDRPKEMSDEEFITGMQFIIMSPGGIGPEIRNRVANMCLRHVTRRATAAWSPVLAAEGTMQFDDIQLPDLARILYTVFDHNRLLDFFSAGPSNSGGPGMENDGQA